MVQIHSVLLHTRLITRLVRVLGAGGGGGRKREREGERGGGGRREKDRHTAEIKECTDLLGCGYPNSIMEAQR